MIKQPYKDLLPPLSTDELEQLKVDVRENGLRNPIVLDEDDNILDGHHRYAVCNGDFEYRVIKGLSEAQKKAFVLRTTSVTRNLSPEQKREVLATKKKVAAELRDEDVKRWTQAAVAKELGLDRSTVTKWFTTNVTDHNGSKPDARVKVTPEGKKAARRRVKSGESQAQVAADLGITQQQVSNIVNQKPKPKPKEFPATKKAMEIALSSQEWRTLVQQYGGVDKLVAHVDWDQKAEIGVLNSLGESGKEMSRAKKELEECLSKGKTKRNS